MTRVFVTGGNGFMGSHVVRQLVRRGYEVTALVGADLDRRNLEGVDVEVRELDLLDERSVLEGLEGGDLLVHNAACYSFWTPDPARIYRVNVDGTRRVMSAARRHGYRKIVHTSTAGTLIPSIDHDLEDEESLFDLRRFQGHYKCSKVLAEIAMLRLVARGLPAVIVNPTTVVGAGDRRPTPTGGLVLHFLNGMMKACADTWINVVDVEDVAVGHVLALEHGAVGHQYVLGGENLQMMEITRILSELTGIPPARFAFPPRLALWAGYVSEWIANHVTHRRPLVEVEAGLHAIASRPVSSDRAVKELGYQPRPARAALARAAQGFLESGWVDAEARRRIDAHGGLRRYLDQLEESALQAPPEGPASPPSRSHAP